MPKARLCSLHPWSEDYQDSNQSCNPSYKYYCQGAKRFSEFDTARCKNPILFLRQVQTRLLQWWLLQPFLTSSSSHPYAFLYIIAIFSSTQAVQNICHIVSYTVELCNNNRRQRLEEIFSAAAEERGNIQNLSFATHVIAEKRGGLHGL